jgi:DNA-binding NtrC family response regulator
MPKRKCRLLIIDDEKDICEFQKSYFKKRGLDTYTSQTGPKAISLARKAKPDIAIIDIHLSKGADGLEILKKLLKIHPLCRCIMVSWDREKVEEAKTLGAAGFLVKPVMLPELEKAVNKIIKKPAK